MNEFVAFQLFSFLNYLLILRTLCYNLKIYC